MKMRFCKINSGTRDRALPKGEGNGVSNLDWPKLLSGFGALGIPFVEGVTLYAECVKEPMMCHLTILTPGQLQPHFPGTIFETPKNW